MDHGGRYL